MHESLAADHDAGNRLLGIHATGWAGVFEVLEFVVLMGLPGFLLGLLGGLLGRRFSARHAA